MSRKNSGFETDCTEDVKKIDLATIICTGMKTSW